MRPIVVLTVLLWVAVLAAAGLWSLGILRDRAQTTRTTPEYDPPVWAGQDVPGACSGGFYARDADTIVLTITPHCAQPGTTLRDGDGRLIGEFGPLAQLAACPTGRFCAPSDIVALALAPDWIPWGHLNLVDLGAGGYRTLPAGAEALACDDLTVGARVELNGRERYRTGRILEVGRYEHAVDTIFPCMAVADIVVGVGDSGAAVLVDGRPAGVISRQLGSAVGFTPLAEGLEHLGLTLCTTPDCDLTPGTAEQPTE